MAQTQPARIKLENTMAARRMKKKASSSTSGRKAKQGGKKKTSWGGRRPGAGRPKGSGSGPSPNSRKNRVAVMFTDAEVSKLQVVAKRKKIPVATVAYNLIARSLKRA